MKKNRAVRMIFATCLAAVLMCGTCMSVFAADTADLDFSREGSISISLYSDEAQAAVMDGALTLYEVADLTLEDGDMVYVKTDAFSGYDGILDIEDEGLAAALADYVAENSVDGTEMDIAVDGSVKFTNLTLGLYLIVQTKESTGYYPVDSFLVTVPLAQGSVWAYSVDATPKVEVYPETITPPGVETPDTEPETPGTDTGTSPGSDSTDTETVTPSGTESGDITTPVPTTTPTVSSGSTLPQTGQLVWPIVVLAVSGGLFFMTGDVMRRKSRAK